MKFTIGDLIYIAKDTQDDDLFEWLEQQPINEFKINEIDYVNKYIWIKNCPYVIRFEDVIKI